jgi:hypothetical protein
MFQVKVVEKIKGHILSSVLFFFENCVIYETVSKNTVLTERQQMAIWQRVACWISKATR